MNQLLLIVPVLLPILGGAFMLRFPEREPKLHPVLTEFVVCTASVLIWILLLTGRAEEKGAVLFYLAGDLKVFFRMDRMAAVFAGLISVLWPLATLYAFSYM